MVNEKKHEKRVCKGSWDSSKKVILLKDRHTYARGLTKTLSSCFSPEFSISVVLKGVKEIKKKKGGKRIGNVVDNQVSVWVNENKTFKNPDPRFLKIQEVLSRNRLNPLVSQLDLACSKLRLGTRVDIVCENEAREIVLVEIKCGFDDFYDVNNGQGNMLKPFEDIEITFRHKHFLQLWLTAWLFDHCIHQFNDRRLRTAYVLRISEDEAGNLCDELTELPVWLTVDTKRLEACLKVLEETRNVTSKKRNSELMNGAQRARRKLLKRS